MSKLSPEAIVAAGVREKAVSFAVDGQPINGILATPENDTPKGVIIFSHGWSGFRAGPAIPPSASTIVAAAKAKATV